MPYIKDYRRSEILNVDYSKGKIEINIQQIKNKGELNYVLSSIMHEYVEEKELNYHTLSDAKDAATGAAEEFARVVLGPYEDKKRLENGSVSDLDRIGQGIEKW